MYIRINGSCAVSTSSYCVMTAIHFQLVPHCYSQPTVCGMGTVLFATEVYDV